MEKKSFLSIYAKSFYWAGFFLPKETYLKCSSLYDFCRTLDNIADDEGTIDVKLRRFLNFKNNFINKEFQNSIIKNMWVLMDEYNISTKIVEDLFDGVETDLEEKVKLNNRKDLLIYSYRVAGTVGLMMAKILNVKERSALLGACLLYTSPSPRDED